MNLDQTLGQICPITGLIGSIIIMCGVLKFFGANIPIRGDGWQIILAGWEMKAF